MNDSSPYIMTTQNAAREGRSAVETLILAASSFDYSIAGRVGFGIEELKTISGATRKEIVEDLQKLLTSGELDNLGFLYYGTSLAVKSWDKISAFPSTDRK